MHELHPVHILYSGGTSIFKGGGGGWGGKGQVAELAI